VAAVVDYRTYSVRRAGCCGIRSTAQHVNLNASSFARGLRARYGTDASDPNSYTLAVDRMPQIQPAERCTVRIVDHRGTAALEFAWSRVLCYTFTWSLRHRHRYAQYAELNAAVRLGGNTPSPFPNWTPPQRGIGAAVNAVLPSSMQASVTTTVGCECSNGGADSLVAAYPVRAVPARPAPHSDMSTSRQASMPPHGSRRHWRSSTVCTVRLLCGTRSVAHAPCRQPCWHQQHRVRPRRARFLFVLVAISDIAATCSWCSPLQLLRTQAARATIVPFGTPNYLGLAPGCVFCRFGRFAGSVCRPFWILPRLNYA